MVKIDCVVLEAELGTDSEVADGEELLEVEIPPT